MKASLGCLWLAFVCAVTPAADDTLTLKSVDVPGEFVEYKLGRLYFKKADGDKLEPMRQGVVSLTLNPPAKVSVRFSNQKRREDLRLRRRCVVRLAEHERYHVHMRPFGLSGHGWASGDVVGLRLAAWTVDEHHDRKSDRRQNSYDRPA